MNELIHKNYSKLVDVEEWGQIVIVNMLGMPGHSLLILRPRSLDSTVPVSFDSAGGWGVRDYKYK